MEILFLENGEMVPAFEQLYPCKVLPSLYAPSVSGMSRRMLIKLSGKDIWLKNRLRALDKFDVLFFNTAASFKIIRMLPAKLKSKCITWLHEQPLSIESWYGDDFTKQSLAIFSEVLCVSSQTKEYLEQKKWLAPAKIHIIPPFVDLASLHSQFCSRLSNESQRPFIVGGCGLQDWRKGTDIFLQVAKKIMEQYPSYNIQFVWVGGESGLTKGLLYEKEKLMLGNKVIFTGATTNIRDAFNGFDIFLLPSREDPFPLVTLEAAAMQKPVICFNGIGDIYKLVSVVPENVVPYLDAEAMAKRILYYFKEREQLQQDGQKIGDKVKQYDTAIGAKALHDIIQKITLKT